MCLISDILKQVLFSRENMRICCELEEGCCGGNIRNTVCTGLSHYMIHGLFVVCFAFTNSSYPLPYYPDFIFGGSGAALFVTAFIAMCVVDLRDFQSVRAIAAFFAVLAMAATVITTFYYTVMRWDDIMTTAITYALRKPIEKDLPDIFWYSLVISACLACPMLIVFSVYIISFMWNDWDSHLFSMSYINNMDLSVFGPPMVVPADTYSSRAYKPYPVQQY